MQQGPPQRSWRGRGRPEMLPRLVRRKEPGPAAPAALLVLLAFALAIGCLGNLHIPVLGSAHPPSDCPVDGNFRVYFLDAGQGDSAVILSGNTTVMIDAGDAEHGDVVVADLRALGVRRIDLLVATHPHADHIGGMEDVLAAFPVEAVLDAGIPHTSPLYENFLDEIDDRGIAYSVAERGETIRLENLQILVLSPPAERAADTVNDNSIVLRISYGTTDILFAGDAGMATEAELLRTGSALDAEVLKVAHHGSSDATSASFLSRVNPAVAVISVGSGNDYGHPHDETLAVLDRAGVTVYRTDRDGTILVVSDGSSYSVQTSTGDLPLTLAPPTIARTPAQTRTPRTTATTAAVAPAETLAPVFTLPSIPLGNGSAVFIAGAQFNAVGDDRLNLNGEWIALENFGNDGVLLAGWTLADESGETLYIFPLYILDPGTKVTIYTGHGDYNNTSLFMNKDAPVWRNSGDTAILKDAGGTVIDRHPGS
ncbi:MAG TPA: lamin tail domain-containing protein [Methanoregulaceae archaeon]|nr:lamin tail domain-containing protein [Methanoregulaceae archaeon]HRY75528.1 lamin tail domain-containing protein [Methanoregulaceae archaeon]